MTNTPLPAPGWYPAAHANNEARYWDGSQWLEQGSVAAAEPATTPQEPAPVGPKASAEKKPHFLRRHWAIIGVGVAGLVIGGIIGGAANSHSEPVAQPTPVPAETVEVEKIVESGAPEICVKVAGDLFDMVTGFNSDIALNYNEALQIIATEMSSGFPDASEIERATGLVQDATDTVSGYTDQMQNGLSADYLECVE